MGNGMNKILPGLYIGNFRDAKDKEQLEANKITHIVSIHDKAAPLLEGVKYKCIKVADAPDQDLSKHFWECIDFIHHARASEGGVLIHCIAGVSRSTTIAAAYIMSVTSLGWKDSINFIRCSRGIANPNLGFQRQLQEFEGKKLDESRGKLRKKYKIDANDDAFAQTLLKDGLERLSKDVEDGLHIDKLAHYERIRTKRPAPDNVKK